MRSDIEIAQACPMQHIRDIAREAGIAEEYLEQYGNYKAKIESTVTSPVPKRLAKSP